MSLHNSWRRWLDGLARRVRGARRTERKQSSMIQRRLGLEALEDRTLLSASLGGEVAPSATYLQSPLSFQANVGQADPSVQFLSRGSGYSLALDATGATLALLSAAPPPTPGQTPAPIAPPTFLHVQLVGANASAQGTGLDEQKAKTNYFVGDASQWRTNVANYGQVRYSNVYQGVDVVYYGTDQRQLEYDFTVAAGADAGQVRLQFSGQQSMEVDEQGNLVLHTAAGDVVEHAPVAYQIISGVRHTVEARYDVGEDGQVGFALGDYDPTQALVIDPVLTFSALLGGSSGDYSEDIAVDTSGNIYITGYTNSSDFSRGDGAPPATSAGSDAFVSKLDASGKLLWSTLVGGNDNDHGRGVAVDSSGNSYITGYTSSTDFPKGDGTPAVMSGYTDVFVSRLDASGKLVWSVLLGGTNDEVGNDIAVDSTDDIYVTGYTYSRDFPRGDGPPLVNSAGADAFVSKLDSSGKLLWSTLVGGNGGDGGSGIAVVSDNIYITGATSSTNFPGGDGGPLTKAGDLDAFVSRLDSSGKLVWSTLVGGTNDDYGYGIALDSSGASYVTGWTTSGVFPNGVGSPRTNAGSFDAFVSRLDSSGNLVWSTLLGGDSEDRGDGIAVDSLGNIYITGYTNSTVFPKGVGSPRTNPGSFDAFVSRLDSSGKLVWSTLVGGTNDDYGYGIALDSSGAIYVTGDTYSTNFPSTRRTSGIPDAFLVKLVNQAVPTVSVGLTGAGVNQNEDDGRYTLTYGTNYEISATVTGTGVDGGTLGTPTLTYYRGTDTSKDGFSTAPTDVGTYTVVANFEGNADYTSGTAQATFTIDKAELTVTPSRADRFYGQDNPTFTGTITGIRNGDNISVKYSTTATHESDAGPYTITASLIDPDNRQRNYNVTLNTGRLLIDRAHAAFDIPDYTVSYDGQPHGLHGTATGVFGEDLSSLLDLGSSPTDVGTYTIRWFFPGNNNYYFDFGSSTVRIVPATSAITFSGTGYSNDSNSYSFTYNGLAQGSAASVTGGNPVSLAYYKGSYATPEALEQAIDSGKATALEDAPTDAGTYTVRASFAGNTNYAPASAIATVQIARASAVIKVQDYSGPYDGQPHGLSGSAVGVRNEDLGSLLNLSVRLTQTGVYTVSWSFAGNNNYHADSGYGTISIGQAPSAISFDGAGYNGGNSYAFTYNGQAHAASASVTGGGAVTLTYYQGSYGTVDALQQAIANNTAVALGGAPVSGGVYTVLASSDGSTNYPGASAVAALTIARVNATITVQDYTGVYDGQPHGPSGSARGVQNEDLGSLFDLGTPHTSAGLYSVNWSFAGNTNYNPASGTATVRISNPAPVLAGVDRASVPAGSATFTLAVSGSGFVPDSVVQWNGATLATTYVNGGQLTAVVPAANLATAGTVAITVVNPALGGGTSDSQSFVVTAVPPDQTPPSPVPPPPAPATSAVAQQWQAAVGFSQAVYFQYFAALGMDVPTGAALASGFAQFNAALGTLRGSSPLVSLIFLNHFLTQGGDPFTSVVLATSLTAQGDGFAPAAGLPTERVGAYYERLGLSADGLSGAYANVLALGWPDDVVFALIAVQHGVPLS